MSMTFLFGLLLSTWVTPEQLAELQQQQALQRGREGWLHDPQELGRQQLERNRRHIAFHEMNIKLFEMLLREHHDGFTPEGVNQMGQEIEKSRSTIEKARKYQKVLEWAQEQRRLKPGLETERLILDRLRKAFDELWRIHVAPPPREKR